MLCAAVIGAMLTSSHWDQKSRGIVADSSEESMDKATVDLLGVSLPALRWQTDEDFCLMVSGGRNIPETGIVLWDCSASTRFSFPPSGEGLIHWVKHPERCIDVNEEKIQLWDCSAQLHSMQWVMPTGDGPGPIRMKYNPDKCITVEGDQKNNAALVIADCEEPKGNKTSGWRSPVQWRLKSKVQPKIEVNKAHQVVCHTAAKGEPCYNEVKWAMHDGITFHANWYPGLNANSSFELFQAAVYKHNATRCPLPCNPTAMDEKPKPEESKPSAAELKAQKAQDLRNKPKVLRKRPAPVGEQGCHTAEKGDECHVNVIWAMQTGIFTNPEWYQGLTKDSTFEDFQDVLHRTVSKANCSKPCKCHTAVAGEDCHDSVVWIFERGLKIHPDWYKGLSQESSYYDVQKRLHQDEDPICDMPCHPPLFRGSPSLFCFSVFRAKGYEIGMMKMQLRNNVGIFACDEYTTVADDRVSIGMGPRGEVWSLEMPPATVGVSKDGTAANTMVFMQAWAMIKYDFRYKQHDWIIKADPDAVVLADRLRNHLAPLTGKSVFVKNCMKYTGPGWPMMFGALEAYSVEALEAYMNGAQKCKNELQWQAWGEDLFMGECMNHLGVGNAYDATLVGDNVCTGAHCGDGVSAAYHPFKSEEKYMECYHTAMAATPAKKLQ